MTNGWKIVLPVFAPLFDALHILDLACFCQKKSLDTTTHRVVSPVLLNITVTYCKELSIKTVIWKMFCISLFTWVHDQWSVAFLMAWCTKFYCRQLSRLKSWIIYLIHAQVQYQWLSDHADTRWSDMICSNFYSNQLQLNADLPANTCGNQCTEVAHSDWLQLRTYKRLGFDLRGSQVTCY